MLTLRCVTLKGSIPMKIKLKKKKIFHLITLVQTLHNVIYLIRMTKKFVHDGVHLSGRTGDCVNIVLAA